MLQKEKLLYIKLRQLRNDQAHRLPGDNLSLEKQ